MVVLYCTVLYSTVLYCTVQYLVVRGRSCDAGGGRGEERGGGGARDGLQSGDLSQPATTLLV